MCLTQFQGMEGFPSHNLLAKCLALLRLISQDGRITFFTSFFYHISVLLAS